MIGPKAWHDFRYFAGGQLSGGEPLEVTETRYRWEDQNLDVEVDTELAPEEIAAVLSEPARTQ